MPVFVSVPTAAHQTRISMARTRLHLLWPAFLLRPVQRSRTGVRCARAACTVPTAGGRCLSQWSPATGTRTCAGHGFPKSGRARSRSPGKCRIARDPRKKIGLMVRPFHQRFHQILRCGAQFGHRTGARALRVPLRRPAIAAGASVVLQARCHGAAMVFLDKLQVVTVVLEWFAELRISMRIFAGFASVLLLVAAMCGAGISALLSAGSRLRRLRARVRGHDTAKPGRPIVRSTSEAMSWRDAER
jgi:hypothetical protein